MDNQQPELTPAELISELLNIRKEIKLIKDERISPLEERKREIEKVLLGKLNDANSDGLKVAGVGSVSRKEEIVPQAEDWSAIYAFIIDNDAFHLLNRALNAAAYRETLEVLGDVPGIKPFSKTKLSVVKAA